MEIKEFNDTLKDMVANLQGMLKAVSTNNTQLGLGATMQFMNNHKKIKPPKLRCKDCSRFKATGLNQLTHCTLLLKLDKDGEQFSCINHSKYK